MNNNSINSEPGPSCGKLVNSRNYPSFDFNQELSRLLKNKLKGATPPRAVVNMYRHSITISDFVSDLLMLEADFDRGEMLDLLIKYDEKRFNT